MVHLVKFRFDLSYGKNHIKEEGLAAIVNSLVALKGVKEIVFDFNTSN